MNTHKRRPVYLDLTRIRMPVNALVSIAHRASGVLLFLAIPLLIYLFDRSLRSVQDFSALVSALNSVFGKLCVLGLVWALLHHLFAGLRYLLLDIHIGLTRTAARVGAWAVFGAEAFAFVVIAGLLL